MVPSTIDCYSHQIVSEFPSRLFDYAIRVSYSKGELVKDVKDIQHPVFRACLQHCGFSRDVELHYAADLPSFTGLGSSSSFTVGLLHALHAFRGERVLPSQLANEAVHIEREVLKECVGLQDQYAAAFGGFNFIEFSGTAEPKVSHISISMGNLELLQQHIVLIFTKIKRKAVEIEQSKNLKNTQQRSGRAGPEPGRLPAFRSKRHFPLIRPVKEGLEKKIREGGRVSPEEARKLYEFPLALLGELANERRNLAKRSDYDGRGEEVVTYIVDRNINYTNVCDVYCKFCAFYRTETDPDHYVLSHDQIDRKIDELVAVGGNQILLQGGHHPKLGLEWYLDLLRHLRAKYPQVNIHGFSPPEFNHFAEVFRMPLEEVLRKFLEAGLGSIPGGGAEILVDRVRQRIAPRKCDTDAWLRVMEVS